MAISHRVVTREACLAERHTRLAEENAFTKQRHPRSGRVCIDEASASVDLAPEGRMTQARRVRRPRSAERAPHAKRAWRAAIVATPAWLIALVLPKCPLCVAALLTSLGVGTTLASGLAPLLKPLAWLWAGLGVVLLLASYAHRRSASRGCCKHG